MCGLFRRSWCISDRLQLWVNLIFIILGYSVTVVQYTVEQHISYWSLIYHKFVIFVVVRHGAVATARDYHINSLTCISHCMYYGSGLTYTTGFPPTD